MDVRLQSLQTDVSLLEGIISYKDQKEKIRACLKQQFKKGDKW